MGTLNNRCRIILGTQTGTIIWTTTHMHISANICATGSRFLLLVAAQGMVTEGLFHFLTPSTKRCLADASDSAKTRSRTRQDHYTGVLLSKRMISCLVTCGWIPCTETVLAEQNSNPTTPHSLTRPQNPSAASEAPRLESPWRK